MRGGLSAALAFERRARAELRARRWLRVHAFVLAALTLALCMGLSHALWRAGLHAMPARHALALSGAYLGYLGLLWLWARWLLSRASAHPDVPDVGLGGGGGRAERLPEIASGQGGDFGGAGAGGSWDAAAADMPLAGEPLDGGALGSVADAAGSLDEGAVVVVPARAGWPPRCAAPGSPCSPCSPLRCCWASCCSRCCPRRARCRRRCGSCSDGGRSGVARGAPLQAASD